MDQFLYTSISVPPVPRQHGATLRVNPKDEKKTRINQNVARYASGTQNLRRSGPGENSRRAFIWGNADVSVSIVTARSEGKVACMMRII